MDDLTRVIGTDEGLSWPQRLLPAALLERRYARRTARALLAVHARVRAADPLLSGHALYTAIVRQHAPGLDEAAATQLLLQALESFCDWPAVRALRLRDLVQYLVIRDYLAAHRESVGTRTNMARIVARLVPAEL